MRSNQIIEEAVRESDSNHVYMAMYKPAMIMSSLQPDFRSPPRPTLISLGNFDHLRLVGRLDKDSEGLILITSDGKFIQQVHDKCFKRYWVLVKGVPSDGTIEKLRDLQLTIQGVLCEPPVSVSRIPTEHAQTNLPAAASSRFEQSRDGQPVSWLQIELRQGKNRQIRRLTQAVGHCTLRLVRMQIGKLCCNLEPGECREIQRQDVLEE